MGGWGGQNVSEQKAYLCIIFQGGPRKQNIFIASKEENWWLKDVFGGNFTLHYLFTFSCAILLGRLTMKLMKLKLWAPHLHRLFIRPQEGPKTYLPVCKIYVHVCKISKNEMCPTTHLAISFHSKFPFFYFSFCDVWGKKKESGCKHFWEAMLCNKRSRLSEKPEHCNWRVAYARYNQRKPKRSKTRFSQ